MFTLKPTAGLVLALLSLRGALAHIALWDPAMYGWDPSNLNQQEPVNPLMNLPFDQWWFHVYIDIPPPAGNFMSLPAGGTYHGQVACNRAFTPWGDGAQDWVYACDTIGPLHTADAYATPNPTDVKGCGIGIAYESDVTKIKPEDFAIISINYTCPWFKDVDFQIPSDLPACPEGGCHCMWGWVHSADSGSEQMYMLGYRCNVTGATATEPIPPPKIANKCDYPSDTSNCTVGAKQPHYWFQSEDNNNPQGTYDPPFYNGAYGFMNGAQTDLFAGSGRSVAVSSAAAFSASSSSAAIGQSSSSSEPSIPARTSSALDFSTPTSTASSTSASMSSVISSSYLTTMTLSQIDADPSAPASVSSSAAPESTGVLISSAITNSTIDTTSNSTYFATNSSLINATTPATNSSMTNSTTSAKHCRRKTRRSTHKLESRRARPHKPEARMRRNLRAERMQRPRTADRYFRQAERR